VRIAGYVVSATESNKMKARRAELLTDVAVKIAELIEDYGLPADVAEQLGHASADVLAEKWGGQYITFPKDFYFRLSRREAAILDEFRSGASYPSLAAKYNMHERSIRRLIARARTRERDDRQMSMFGS
jgi:Mor family transcriptional regulator